MLDIETNKKTLVFGTFLSCLRQMFDSPKHNGIEAIKSEEQGSMKE